MWQIKFHHDAHSDFDDALDWYLARDVRTAQRFLIAVDDAIESILHDPERNEQIAPDIRSQRTSQFPYRIVYRLRSDEIQILAFAHTSRRPGYWNPRLEG